MMFIGCAIIKRCVHAPRPKCHAGEALIITTAIQIGWMEWPGARGTGRGWDEGEGDFPWMNQYCSLLCFCAELSGYYCRSAWKGRNSLCVVCVRACVCTHKAIFTPLWVIEKSRHWWKMLNISHYRTSFFLPWHAVIWAHVSWGSSVW